jgi:hypothetical protein
MTQTEAEAKARAVGWQIAAEIGWREAIEILQRIAREIESKQWEGPGNR